jgi:hypothetical protein
VQKSSVAKYGLDVDLEVSRRQPLYVAGNGLPLPAGSVTPAAWLARSVAAGWLALSVRQNSAAVAPRMPLGLLTPSVRYRRVLPFFTVGATITRSRPPLGANRAAKTFLKSVAEVEPSRAGERRHRPWSNAAAYTVVGSSGSSPMSVTPKEAGSLPFQISVKVAPPSCDS